jgi:hypothetical protein
MKLVIAIDSREHWLWLRSFDFHTAQVEGLPFYWTGDDVETRTGLRISHGWHPNLPELPLPSFGEIIEGLHDAAPEACLVFGDGPLARLLTMGADFLGISVFTLVETEERLANLGVREKQRPDLHFLARVELLPIALRDSRYGSTLLPTGHPARDLALRGEEGIPRRYHEDAWGDGRAAWRILEAIDRWRSDRLESANPDLSIVVPAFREAENLPMVCGRLLAVFEATDIQPEIILVDDASPDETYQVATAQMWTSPRIRAISKSPPRGMGNAIRRGMTLARSPVIAITMADGSDEVDRIPEMYRKVCDHGFALAIGSRYRFRKNYAAVPKIYRFWSACFRLCTRALVGLKLSDYTNAFRVFDRRIFARYGPESGGFEISPEITFKAWFATRKVTEVDVRHLKRASGQSSFSFLRAGPGYGKMLIKAFVNRLTGRWFTLDW